jgi:SAM-dependent methyltransferase
VVSGKFASGNRAEAADNISSAMVPFISLAVLLVVANVYLFVLYRVPAPKCLSRISRWSAAWLDFDPWQLGGFSYGQLGLASAAGLFLELLMIRWISSEIPVFSYFKNFVLIACFLGFGLGCCLCRRRVRMLALLVSLLVMTLVISLPWPALRELLTSMPSLIGGLSEVDVWGVPSLSGHGKEMLELAKAVLIVVPLFGLVAFLFVPLGQLVGWYLERADRGIRGYTINIFASLAGILAYTALCFMNQPPSVWLATAGVLVAWLVWRRPTVRWALAVVFSACVALTALTPHVGRVFWSPYQRLIIRPLYFKDGELASYQLRTNDSWYQNIYNLSPEFTAKHPEAFSDVPAEWNPYNLPYRFFPNPGSVLVLGAGTGNDVAAALRNGAQRVVAVEIDPLIERLGSQLHFERPYSSPKVQVVVNDARSYVEKSREQFDVIMFSLLDSHTTSSYYTNIRIDNYVYTIEALQAAKRLLKPDGLLILKFWVETPWIEARLTELTQIVFGRRPMVLAVRQPFYGTMGDFFFCGSPERLNAALAADPSLLAYARANALAPSGASAALTTDDWPYFYQHEPGLPSAVLLMSLVLLVLGWLLLRNTGVSVGSLDWHFFFLGAGFFLLEAQIISKMALLFGTTWLVNSIAISGLLLLIVGSNVLVEYSKDFNIGFAYAGIFASMIVSYAIPMQSLFVASYWLKALAAVAVLGMPVFFAGIVFIRSFAAAGFQGSALGSNLFGALVGGLLESLSMWTGIRSLLVVASLLYLASWLTLRARRSLPSAPGLINKNEAVLVGSH